MQKEFNLIDENWIKVVDLKGNTEEVSLFKLFLDADKYIALAGELPTQNMATLRFLEGILHAMVTNYDTKGLESRLEDAWGALARWEKIWKMGFFPNDMLRRYFKQWHERFWLFHPTRPFYQMPGDWKGTDYKASKLIGEIWESNSKPRFFLSREGEGKEGVSFGEAARWLIHLNAFDDAACKAKAKGLPSSGVGWLGKLGPIAALGTTLFETLMLNLVLFDDNGVIWDSAIPSWELPELRTQERCIIPVPHDQAALLTLQSRRIQLKANGDRVVGYKLIGGDFFENRENVFEEQMTIWRAVYGSDRKTITGYIPQLHDHSSRIWRRFNVLTVADPSRHLPGVVRWMNVLKERGAIGGETKVGLQTAAVVYGDKNCCVDDIFGDSLIFSSGILGDDAWQSIIARAVAMTTGVAESIERFVYNIGASVNKDSSGWQTGAAEEYYFDVDIEFRRWLGGINPIADDPQEALNEFKATLLRIAYINGKRIMRSRGLSAIKGRTNNDTGKLASGANAYGLYKYYVKRTIEETKEETNEGTGTAD